MNLIKTAKLIYDERTLEPTIQFEGRIPLMSSGFLYDDLPAGMTNEDVIMEFGIAIMNEIKEHCQQSKPDYQTWE